MTAPERVLDLPEEVRVVETLPRDGLQGHDAFVPTDRKVDVVERLAATGVDAVEVSSFTHPDAVPNLRDADEVFDRIDRREDVTYRALVPNAVGMERALDAGVDAANALVTVSDTYARKNQNMTADETLAALRDVVERAHDARIPVEAGISTAFFCPYDGSVPLKRTLDVVDAAVDAGADAVTLAMTMGMATPAQVDETLAAVRERHPDCDLGLHLHDTNGMSLANALVGLRHGVDRFDTAACGLGGGVVLPEGLDGVGNTPTEDFLQFCEGVSVEAGVDAERFYETSRAIADDVDIQPTGHVLNGGTPAQVLDAMNE